MYKAIQACAITGLVPYIVSEPGLGKSALVKKFAKDNKLKLIDLRLSSLEPVDLAGAIKVTGDLAQYVPFDVFPIKGKYLEPEYEGILLFLDELPSAHRQVLAASYRLILDRSVGQYELDERCVIICAGNSIHDKAIVNNIGTALQSRMIMLNLQVTAEEWVRNVAIPQNYDERIIAFVTAYPDQINTFSPKLVEESFSSPRTLEFANKLLSLADRNDEVTVTLQALLIGALGSKGGTALISFLKVYGLIPTVEEIVADQMTAKLPTDPETQWATIVSLLLADISVIPKVNTYVSRMPSYMQRFYYSHVIEREGVIGTPLAYELDKANSIATGRLLLS